MSRPNLQFEQKYQDYIVGGIDEAGRGPLAGPVVAACVVIDQSKIINDINDSKKISKTKRIRLYNFIVENYFYAVGVASVAEIDQYNILQATKLAMQRAYYSMQTKPNLLLIDGNMTPALSIDMYPIIKGDTISQSIAAASIVAKVTRDNIMQNLAIEYDIYNWQNNAGYGTKQHLEAISRFGITQHHRQSFAPVKKLITTI